MSAYIQTYIHTLIVQFVRTLNVLALRNETLLSARVRDNTDYYINFKNNCTPLKTIPHKLCEL